MIEPNTFLTGDCLPILRELPDGFADLVAQQDLFMPEPETKIEQERLEI